MAYRTFRNEPTYAAPEIDLFPKTLNILQNIQQAKQRQQQNNRALAATYQADKLASNFTTDQEELNHLSNANTQAAVKDMMNNGVLTPATRDRLGRAMGAKQISDAQWKAKEDLEKMVNDRVIKGPKPEKNYYDKSFDQQQLIDAAYGKDDERVTWANRGDRLKNTGTNIGKNYIHSFNKEAFLNDYVDELKTQTMANSNKSQSGIKNDKKVTAVFLDENGVPKVTGQHAIDFLNSSEDVRERYKQEVDLELLDDARKMAATKEGSWLRDFTPDQIVQKFRENPELNTESKIKPGERERQLAMKDLERKQKVNIDNAYDASGSEAGSDRGLTSKDYTIENSFNPNALGGPGLVFIDKKKGTKGIPINIGKAYDKGEQRITGNNRSPRKLFADSANLLPVDTETGIPLEIPGNSVDEQIKYLDKLPDNAFKNLQMKTVVHGKSYNDTALDEVRKDYEALALTPEDMMSESDRQRFGKLGKTLEAIGADPDMAPEIIQKNLGVKVEDILKVVEPGTNEAREIQGKLGKFDITNPKNWDEDQLKLNNYFNQRKAKAEGNQYGLKEKQKRTRDNIEKITGKAIPEPITPEEFNTKWASLKSGESLVGPDGTSYTKK